MTLTSKCDAVLEPNELRRNFLRFSGISIPFDSFVDAPFSHVCSPNDIYFICVSGMPVTLRINFVNRYACS